LIIGGMLVFEGQISIGMLISAFLIIDFLSHVINEVILSTTSFSDFKASSRRIVSILEENPNIDDSPTANDLDNPTGDIDFKDVTFTYGNEPVLKDINLRIPANNSIALLGSTGSGKSSLINLVIRFYDPTGGSVLIDDINLKDIKLNSLRKNIGFVDQETFLFSRSIIENIKFGKPHASDAEVFRVTKIANIHNFILTLPDKYDTIIGERGVTLSGGQKQRLSIARALLVDPKIIIFDDSLSAVDLKTEHQIREALTNFLTNRTVIFVTQRISITSIVDKIVILNNGQIVEQGSHEELLSQNMVYTNLFNTQIDDVVDLSIIQ
jgi:ABC-type multidrug transport system fused ATPase/permease subunit